MVYPASAALLPGPISCLFKDPGKDVVYKRRQPLRLQLKPAMRRCSCQGAAATRTPHRRQPRARWACRQPTAWPRLGHSSRARGHRRRAPRSLQHEVRRIKLALPATGPCWRCSTALSQQPHRAELMNRSRIIASQQADHVNENPLVKLQVWVQGSCAATGTRCGATRCGTTTTPGSSGTRAPAQS